MVDIKSGRVDEALAPIYSHLVYDVVPGEKVAIRKPDIVIVEGLDVLQPARALAMTAALASRSRTSSTSACPTWRDKIRERDVSRFWWLRETAFRDPVLHLLRDAALQPEEAVAEAERIWDMINGPNLVQNIFLTRACATLATRKDCYDTPVRYAVTSGSLGRPPFWVSRQRSTTR